MENFWKILLKKQQKRGKSGFTLPYLIGSQIFLPKDHVFQNIEDLIIQMADNDEFETCIRYCINTCTLIFEIRKLRNQVFYIINSSGIETKLSIAIANKDLGETITQLVSELQRQFQEKIDLELYSAKPYAEGRQADWTDFSESDIKEIKTDLGI